MYTLYVYDIYIMIARKKEEMIINIIRVNTIPLITKISFGGIPNSRNALLLQIFLKRAAKPSAGTFSGALLNLTWLHQSLPAQTFSGTFSGTGTLLNLTWLHQRLPDRLQNFLRNPVETDLALHQSLLEPSLEPSPEPSLEPCWIWPGSAPKPPRASPEPSPEPCWTWLGLHQSLPDLLRNLPEPCWTWPGSAPKPPLQNPVDSDLALHHSLPDLHRNLLRNLLRNPVEPDLALHQSLSCWTWFGFAPRLPATFSGALLNLTWLCTKASWKPSPEPCWTWPGSGPKPPKPSSEPSPNPVEPDLALHQSLPDLLRKLRNLLRNLVEPDPAPASVHTGAILGWRPH